MATKASKLRNPKRFLIALTVTIISLEITFIQVSIDNLSKSGRSALGLRSPLRFKISYSGPTHSCHVMFRSASLIC